jgi:hypothetical protein
MGLPLFAISAIRSRPDDTVAAVSPRFVIAMTKRARRARTGSEFRRASPRNGRGYAHPRERASTEWQLPFAQTLVPYRTHVPVRRRIMEGLFVATSLVLLWLIILAIDDRAGFLVMDAVRSGLVHNGAVASGFRDTATHVTRSVWELSFIYGPLMTFAAVALVLVAVMTRTTK